MQAAAILRNEHRVIERVLDCLEEMARRALEDGRLDAASALQALDFFRNFCDRSHHAKEEKHLFPLLEARGLSRAPTLILREEHDRGRTHLHAMAALVEPAAQGNSNALTQFAHQAGLYVQLLRDHIWKEDNRLFEMADVVLTYEDQHRLVEAFAGVENHDMPACTVEEYLRLADELADRFKVTGDSVKATESGGCFHYGR